MKKHLSTIFLVVLLLAGVSLLLYPTVSDYWNTLHATAAVTSYAQQVRELDNEKYEQMLQQAQEYNRGLLKRENPFLLGPQEREAYPSLLNLDGTGIMGYIEIPAIDVSLPIYHGTTPATLEKGAGHLEGSALPVGGAGTHCVISAHRGLPSAAMFTDLDQLALGDHFYIYVLDRVLAYEVDQILTVAPDELSALDREPDMDYTTLVTCTPYGVNTHRLLVRGHRVDYVPQTAADEGNSVVHSVHTNYVLWTVVGLLTTAAFIALYVSISRRDSRSARRPRARRGKYQARH